MNEPPLLLVTTTRAAWLLDTATGRAHLIDRGRGVYYGISFDRDHVFIACRQVEVGADRRTQDNVILCFDRGLRPAGILRPPAPVRDVHQICQHGGILHVCSTYDDAVMCHDLGQGTWRVWHPFGEAPERDRHHINSITIDDVGILLAGNRPAGWFAAFGPDRAPLSDGPRALGTGTHNVWRQDGVVAVCSSDEGAIRTTAGGVQSLVARGWLRGVARDGDHRYVGVSQNRVRGIRDRSDCMILRVDPAGSIARVFAFHGYGMVHDIRLVGLPDDTHNGTALLPTPVSFSTAEASYQTDDRMIMLVPAPGGE